MKVQLEEEEHILVSGATLTQNNEEEVKDTLVEQMQITTTYDEEDHN